MSIEAIRWALNDAPNPTGRRDSSSLAVVLIGLANHADPDGRNAFPSIARLTGFTRLSERFVRSILRDLEQLHLIYPSDPGIVAAYIRRADRRPNGYDLNLTAVDNPTTPVDNSADSVDNTSRGLGAEGHSVPPADQHEGQTPQLRGAGNNPTGVHTARPRATRSPQVRPPRHRERWRHSHTPAPATPGTYLAPQRQPRLPTYTNLRPHHQLR